ncbi:MAG: tetratricopeptide repeat protein [Desulfuromonadaceae bacterium]
MFKLSKISYDIAISIVLLGLITAVYYQITSHQFINYDDPSYITENIHIQAGLTWEGVRWAFTTVHEANWHPLTWISHMLDVELFGLNAGRHHLVSLLLHASNTLLLLLVLNRMTGKRWESVFVAALFALHPLHVESVAWSAERKDVLSTYFWMLTMLAYLRYVKKPGVPNFLLLLLLFACGLMAKPMLVTLPFVLMILDYWPLERVLTKKNSDAARACQYTQISFLRSIIEKLPLLGLSVISCIITYLAQKSGGAVTPIDTYSLPVNAANALVSYVRYIGKMFWPAHLGIFYPHPGTALSLWKVAGAAFFLLMIMLLTFRFRRRCPYLLSGWLWYLVTLVPVIGIVRIGAQGMADRYTYVPLIGLFIAVSWGTADLTARLHLRKEIRVLMAITIIFALSLGTWRQAGFWHSSAALFQHTVDVTGENPFAHNMLGAALMAEGKSKAAVPHFLEALRLKPHFAMAHYNLALVFDMQGKINGAEREYKKSLEINPYKAEPYNNLGLIYLNQRRSDEAEELFRRALNLKQGNVTLYNNLALLYIQQGKLGKAESLLKEALGFEPNAVETRYHLGLIYAGNGHLSDAEKEFIAVLSRNSIFTGAYYNLGLIYIKQGRLDEAFKNLKKALNLSPGNKTYQELFDKVSRIHQQNN